MKIETRSSLGLASRRALCIILWLAFAAVTSWAELRFEMVEGQLWITLSNPSEAGAFYPGGIGCSSPAPNPGPIETDRNIGGEWAYVQYDSRSSSQIPTGQRYAIRAVGFDVVGPSVRFDPTQNLSGQSAIDGGNFSLGPKGGIPTPTDGHFNGGLISKAPFIMHSALFALTSEKGFDLSAAVRNVRFQYGTDLSETSILATPVPEPITMAMIGAGLIGLGILRRRAAR